MGPDQENSVGNEDTGSSGRPVSSALQVPGEQGIVVVQEQNPVGDLPAACVFPSKCHSTAPAEMSNIPR